MASNGVFMRNARSAALADDSVGVSVLKNDQAKKCSGPIFVVGSPRSGTSILTWCLGQHANILPQEESCWLGEFAVSVGVQFKRGSLHGQRSQLLALGIARGAFFRSFGDSINMLILAHRRQQERMSRACGRYDPSQTNSAFTISRSDDEPKSRWVDGTPEYSYYITGLRKLFPNAQFVHIVRDVQSVVNSMLHFKMSDGSKLVDTEQQAYEYWLGTVRACVRAEQAYGRRVIYRLHYEDLIKHPEQVMRGVLEFLGEPYMDTCLLPLATKINSSGVAANFDGHDPHTDQNVINQAHQLSERLQKECYLRNSKAILKKVEAEFDQRIDFVAGLDENYAISQKKVEMLTKRLNCCGEALLANLLLAATITFVGQLNGSIVSVLWFILSSVSVLIYAFIRRKGVCDYVARLLHKHRARNCGHNRSSDEHKLILR
jgi:hypothetical protein